MFSASLASAQTASTALRGLAKDPSGAVIPNVSLTLKDKATGIEKTTMSGDDGSFPFSNPGGRHLPADCHGHRVPDGHLSTGIVVNTGRMTDLPVSMKIGAVSTTVEVTAAGVRLETTSNTVSTTIKNANIQTLP